MTTSSSIIIRSFQPSDLPECQKIFLEGHRSYDNPTIFTNMVLQSDMSDIKKNYLEAHDGHWWVAVSTVDNRIVGQIAGLPLCISEPSFYKQLPEDKREKIYELRRMGVASSVQREGVGSRLVSTLVDFARSRGYCRVYLTTLTSMGRARAFYEKHGFAKGQVDKIQWENIDVESMEEALELFKNRPKPTVFETNDVIPEEDQQLMKLSPRQSKHTFVQHYSLNL